MIHRLYQRLMPVEMLIYVGDAEIPDHLKEWLVPVTQPLVVTVDAGVTTKQLSFYTHTYRRYKGALGDMFVAEVETKLL